MVYVIYYMHDVEGIFNSGELEQSGLDLLCILKIVRHIVFLRKNSGEVDSEWQAVQEDIMDFLEMEYEEMSDLMLSEFD
jgi:hypothetical protein